MMRDCDIIRRIKKHDPRKAQDLLDYCELPLQYIGGGMYRDAYHVLGTSVVIKMPRVGKSIEINKQHSRDEITIWKQIRRSKKKYAAFKEYLPEIISHDGRTGITLVRKYDNPKHSRAINKVIKELDAALADVLDLHTADIHYNNLGLDKDGSIKIIDLGMFLGGA